MGEHNQDPNLKIGSMMLRDTAIDAINAHERVFHAGARCPDERANLVAYLAHALQLNGNEFVRAMEIAADYQRRHDDHNKG